MFDMHIQDVNNAYNQRSAILKLLRQKTRGDIQVFSELLFWCRLTYPKTGCGSFIWGGLVLL